MAEDTYQALLARRRKQWGLPVDASPRAISDAERRQEALALSYVSQSGSLATIANMRRLGEQLGLAPEQYDPEGHGGVHWPVIWTAVCDADHRYCRLSRTEDGIGWIVPDDDPPADSRIAKIEALAADPAATAGEAAAARAALARIGSAA